MCGISYALCCAAHLLTLFAAVVLLFLAWCLELMNVYGGVSINKPIIVTQNSCRHSYIHKVCLRDQHYRQDVHTHTQPYLHAKQSRETYYMNAECVTCTYWHMHEYIHTFPLAALKPVQHWHIPVFTAAHLVHPCLPSCKETLIFPGRFLLS